MKNMKYKTTEKITQGVINEILKIKKEEGLTAEQIITAAKHKKSQLHNLFDWDDNKAGDKWRLHQARILINEVKIIVGVKEYYAFENVSVEVKNKEHSKREYMTRSEIISNVALRQQVVKKAYEHLLYWKGQYQQYSEFEPIFEGIEEVGRNIEKKEITVEHTATKAKKAVA